ncbi:MAG: Mrp/NBP35 family ATP-binding protein [Anaerolineae bacterium]|nr:Mrp/NBP35 family ATP-binding protein [Anaerolineae bacterium]
MLSKERILGALAQVIDPELGRSIVELGMVRDLQFDEDGRVSFTLALTIPTCPLRDKIAADARAALTVLQGVTEVSITMGTMTEEERKAVFAKGTPNLPRLNQFNHIKRIIAVMSGKGGVGKSSVTALLAVALTRQGQRVGVLDADITGPSIPKLFALPAGGLRASEQGFLPAVTPGGIRVVSINLLLRDEGVAVIWRGPMISGAIRQFWNDALWGKLDYLLVDLPPGTSDAALSVLQEIPVNDVILVTTPQSLSAMVVRKAVSMIQQLKVPILGVVENMGYYRCPDTGNPHYIFGSSHAGELAAAAGAPILATLPIDPQIAALCDAGRVEEAHLTEIDELVEKILVNV